MKQATYIKEMGMSMLNQDMFNKLKDEYAQGNIEEAEPLCLSLLDSSPDDLEMILLLEYQSNILRDRGKIAQAIDVREKQLECIEKKFGKEHTHAASVLHNLALLYSRRGLLPKALEYSEQAVAILKKNLAENNPRIADAIVNLSMQYYGLSKFDKAEALLKEALAVYLQAQGEDSFGASTCYNNLGRIYEHLEETEKAVQFHAKAVDIRKRTLGSHRETAFCLGNYATALAGNGQLKEAVAMFNEALEIYTELGLENSEYALTCLSNKQICITATGHCP